MKSIRRWQLYSAGFLIASLCSSGVLPSDTCQSHLRACEKLLGSSAETLGRSIEILQEQSVITGAGK